MVEGLGLIGVQLAVHYEGLHADVDPVGYLELCPHSQGSCQEEGRCKEHCKSQEQQEVLESLQSQQCLSTGLDREPHIDVGQDGENEEYHISAQSQVKAQF